jgi:molybdate transport system regulatory protein
MEPKVNLWIEVDDQVVLSRWRVQLLKTIAETGSISSGAERMGVPYRRAWERIHEMEKRLGVPLLDTHTGGPGGGGARLTPVAKDYISRFQEFSAGIDLYVQRHFQAAFGTCQTSPAEDTPG